MGRQASEILALQEQRYKQLKVINQSKRIAKVEKIDKKK